MNHFSFIYEFVTKKMNATSQLIEVKVKFSRCRVFCTIPTQLYMPIFGSIYTQKPKKSRFQLYCLFQELKILY